MFRTAFLFTLLLLPNIALAQTFTLPDTGQTKCYNNTSGAEIACTDTGQDGAYNINPMSYTDNGNGTITDNVTGLMWQKEDDNTKRTWVDAGTYCSSLTLGGQQGWRLPSKEELMSIVDYSIPRPGPTINTTYFPNTNASPSSGYWSSTTVASNTYFAWIVYFKDGDVLGYGYKPYGDYVRCVRGGQSSPPFSDNSNGTVTDNGTGLMWQQGEPGRMTWANALTYCEGLSLGGQSDWRLPNIKELASITDDTKHAPAIDTTYFPNTLAYDYWSSTTHAYYTDTAWDVELYYGYVSFYTKPYNHYVRCVRGGQAGSSVQNCAATLSSDLKLHIPILTFNGQSYWADLQYKSGSNFSLSNAGTVTDTSSCSSCTAATLSSDYKQAAHLSADLQ